MQTVWQCALGEEHDKSDAERESQAILNLFLFFEGGEKASVARGRDMETKSLIISLQVANQEV
jgi:hypothetical protein